MGTRIPTFKTKLTIQRFQPKSLGKSVSPARLDTEICRVDASLKDLPPIYNRLLSTLMIQQSAEDAEEEESDED